MSLPCTVLIAAPDLLPDLEKRAADGEGEVLLFSDADALRALEMIIMRRPGVVAIERLFAATPRGTALINRLEADPSLLPLEIRVVSHDSEYSRVPIAAPKALLDQRGTRRAPRFRIASNVDVSVDGNPAALADLSLVGAQVVSAVVLKPDQRVRMALSDEAGTVIFNAAVAWARFEIPPDGGPRYRAGLDFVDADQDAVDAYCSRHRVFQ